MLLFTYFLVIPCDSSSVTILRKISFMRLQILLVQNLLHVSQHVNISGAKSGQQSAQP